MYARDMLLFPAEGDNCKLGKDTRSFMLGLHIERFDFIKQHTRNNLSGPLGSDDNLTDCWEGTVGKEIVTMRGNLNCDLFLLR